MVDRYRAWFGAGVLAGGVSAAMLAGAGAAAADDGSSAGSGAAGSAGSSDSDSSKNGPKAKAEADKPSRAATDSDADADAASDSDASSEDSTQTDPEESPDDTSSTPATGEEADSEADPDVAENPDDEVVEPGEQPAESDEESPGGQHRAPDVDDEPTPAETPADDIVEVPTTEAEPEQAVPQGADAVVDSDSSEVPSTFVSSVEADLTSESGAVVMQAAAASIPGFEGAPPGLLDFFNDVGTLVYNFYTSAMQFISGPARAPFGSSVRVESSTLTLGDGVVVQADWYFPEDEEAATGLIYFQHGFLATGSFYSATAAYLAETTNSIVVVPTLTWNIFDTENYPLMLTETHRAIAELFVGDRSVLNASAQAAGFAGTLPTRVVLAGHSAGGGLVTGTARYMVELGVADDLAGVIMFDGAGYLDQMSVDLAQIPHSIPVYNLAAEPDSWNTFGDTNVRLAQARPGMFTGALVEGGRHSDSMQSTSPMIQFLSYLATGYSSPSNIDANEILGAGWINDMFAGTHTATLYGAPGTTLIVIDGWWRQKVAHILPTEWVELSVYEQVFACLLNPTTIYCSYLPWFQSARWFEPMAPHRLATVAA